MEITNTELNFLTHKDNFDIIQYAKCLEKYSTSLKKEISLKSKSPIFLDTNILLRYYSISFTAREKLYEFIKLNKDRIIITSQVQYEFIKNREDVIQKFFEQVTNKIPKDFKSDVLNKMKSFLDTHKVVLKDYPFVETGIEKHTSELEKLLEKLNETAEQNRKDKTNLIIKDSFLDLLQSCKLNKKISEKEIEILKKDFDLLKKGLSTEKPDSIFNKTNLIFPGLGDIKEKPDDPYGDYIIFHEIMKYMSENKSNVIFLTLDNTKGDWMSKSKTPYLHYVQNIYSNTNQIIYILDAERTLEQILNVNIQSLVTTDDVEEIEEITIDSLTQLANRNPILKDESQGQFADYVVKELKVAGYNSISQVENDLNRGSEAISEYITQNGQLNTVGLVRVTLRIVNPLYLNYVDNNGVIEKLPRLEHYSKYRSYVTS